MPIDNEKAIHILIKASLLVYAYVINKTSNLGIFALAITLASIRFCQLDLERVNKSASEYVILFIALSLSAKILEPLIALLIKEQRGLSAYYYLTILLSITTTLIVAYVIYYAWPYSTLAIALISYSVEVFIIVGMLSKVLERYI